MVIAAAGAAIAIGALAACGGTPALPVPDVVTRVNAICTSYAEHVEALAAPSFTPASATAAQLGTVARYLDRSLPLLRSEQGSIEAVGEPRTDRGMFDSVVTALAAHVRDEGDAQAAAHAGNLRAFRTAIAKDKSDSTHLAGAAEQFGLTKCV